MNTIRGSSYVEINPYKNENSNSRKFNRSEREIKGPRRREKMPVINHAVGWIYDGESRICDAGTIRSPLLVTALERSRSRRSPCDLFDDIVSDPPSVCIFLDGIVALRPMPLFAELYRLNCPPAPPAPAGVTLPDCCRGVSSPGSVV